jgi:flavin-dependent dehydrogenase
VLVVGGGPAGLAAAIALRMRGADVLVADSLRPPIDKACGEGLMPDARRGLAALGVDCEAKGGATFRGIRFANWADMEPVSVAAEFGCGEGSGIPRTMLHTSMVERAQSLGVRFRWGTHVGLGAGITLNQNACRYRYLVGADGQSSRVRGWAGLDEGKTIARRFGFRRHYRVAPWSQYVEVHWTAMGQVYITPVSGNEICVAVVTRNSAVRIRDVVNAIPFLRERLPHDRVRDTERGAVTMTRRLKRVENGNVALIGDASGSVDAIAGEGLALSFRQAMLLGESITNGGLEVYATAHRKILAKPQRMTRLLLLMDAYPAVRNYAMHVLAGSPGLFRGMIDLHLGDSTMLRFLLNHGADMAARLVLPGVCPAEW